MGDRWRSVPLETVRASEQGARRESDQSAKRTGQRAIGGDLPGLVDLGSELTDFADTAAALQSLDLVVTVDTAVAHLAGALGLPVWVAVPLDADWRWLREREDNPWYPSARLFRQTRPGDWDEVFQHIAAELAERIGGLGTRE